MACRCTTCSAHTGVPPAQHTPVYHLLNCGADPTVRTPAGDPPGPVLPTFLTNRLTVCLPRAQVNQPSWGHGGPHDAGSYCVWPHQTGFFHQHGNWGSPYGKFFLQVRHVPTMQV